MMVVSVLLGIVGWVLAAVFAIVLMILVVPFSYAASGEKYEAAALHGRISWLFGLLRGEFAYDGGQINADIHLVFFQIPLRNIGNKKDKKEKTKKQKTKKGNKRWNISMLWDMGRKILKHAAPDELDIQGRIGFDEPHQTGILCAFLAYRDILPRHWNIGLQPEFSGEVFEGRAQAEGRIILVIPALIALSTYIRHRYRKARKRGLIEKESV